MNLNRRSAGLFAQTACGSDADCPDGFFCDGGECFPEAPNELVTFVVDSTRGVIDGDRNTFLYRVLVEGYIEQHPNDVDDNDQVRVVNEDPLRMEATGETGNGFEDIWLLNGTVLEAEVTETLEGPTVTPRDGMIWVVDGTEYGNPEGVTGPRGEPPTPQIAASVSGLTVDLDGSGSKDPDGQIVEYNWDIDGSIRTGAQVSHTFGESGTYTVTLTVVDNDGLLGAATRDVTVEEEPPPGEPPLADFDVVADGLTVDVDATPSVDPDGQIVSYEWTAGGQSATGQMATFTFDSEGFITVTLTVTDDAGMQDQMAKDVEVIDDSGGTPDPSEGGLTIPMLLLLAGAGAGVGYILTRNDDPEG